MQDLGEEASPSAITKKSENKENDGLNVVKKNLEQGYYSPEKIADDVSKKRKRKQGNNLQVFLTNSPKNKKNKATPALQSPSHHIEATTDADELNDDNST